MNLRQLFLQHVAQTSIEPLSLDIIKAEGIELTDRSGKKYIDLIGGISVANTGHRHPLVLKAIQDQIDKYLHVMVYGEFIQSPQVQYAALLTAHLPENLNSVYFTNSGSEAIEGAMKLAKRATGRAEIASFNFSYHGSTQGALSIIGSEYWRNSFRPLLPGINHLEYNSFSDLKMINEFTACVIVETVQAEAGIIAPDKKWVKALAQKCKEVGAMLVLDEVQAAFGRTGTLWAFEQFEIIPDILVLGKALGGGMPLGAFISDKSKMDLFTENPILGHITTFGGHPVSCAAGKAAFEMLLNGEILQKIKEKESLFKKLLVHPNIKQVRSCGLWLALELETFEKCKYVIEGCIKNGLLIDWFLFASNCIRISPPLVIDENDIKKSCDIILEQLNNLEKNCI